MSPAASSSLSPADLARRIDHTLLRAEALEADVRRVVAEALEHRFASVCVNPCHVRLVRSLIEDAGAADEHQSDRPVKTCAVAGFPFGTNLTEIKAAEAASCVKEGAQEVDMVAYLPALLENDLDYARNDIQQVVAAARHVDRTAVIKVILETALLEEAQVALGCRAAREAGADFVKTSTGLHPRGGASVQAVQWLRKYAGSGEDALQVKAAGGIRDLATARAMLQAGADRLGCSASVALVRQTAGA